MILQKQKKIFTQFWESHPALFFSLIFLSGLLFLFSTPYAALFALLCLFGANLEKQIVAILLFFAAQIFCEHYYYFPKDELKGEFIFRIQSIEKSNKNFLSHWIYTGKLLSFKNDQGKISRLNIPCRTYSKQFVKAKSDFHIFGTLICSNGHNYILKTNDEWKAIEGTRNMEHLRFLSKEKVKKYIYKRYESFQTAPFLTALTTGIREDPVLLYGLVELGLSHLLAISGFHFGILALFFHLLLKRLFHFKIQALLSICLLTIYALFVGLGPSIERAWLFCILLFCSQLLERRANGLNLLGVVMLISLILNPLSATNLSFQLTFLATGAIFLFYKPIHQWLELLFPTKTLLASIQKHFKSSFALTLSVNLVLTPLLLLLFGKFPLHSLLYNLFFPSLVALCLIGFILCSLLELFFAPLGLFLHHLNNQFMTYFLKIVESRPLYEKTFYVEYFSPFLLLLLWSLLFTFAIFSSHKKN